MLCFLLGVERFAFDPVGFGLLGIGLGFGGCCFCFFGGEYSVPCCLLGVPLLLCGLGFGCTFGFFLSGFGDGFVTILLLLGFGCCT